MKDMDDSFTDSEHDTDSSTGSYSSSTTSSERFFNPQNLPLVLELHDIRKDEPPMPSLKPSDTEPPVGPTGLLIKKHKKNKKKVPGAQSNSSGSSLSEASSVAPSNTDLKEEFYDAHESYHAIPENQKPVALATALTVHSETIEATAKAPDVEASTGPETTSPPTMKEPSAIIKPTAPP